jgi:prevent-host-death family protein
MPTRVSVAEARQNLPRLIQSAERGRVVEITRRGEPVAVLISAGRFQSLSGERPSFSAAVAAVRERHGVFELGIGDAELAGLRDRSPGRNVEL